MRVDGQPLTSDGMQASLLLLMGRNGPAFLAYPNFRTFLTWNNSLTYSTTAAYLATRYAGARPMLRGNGHAVPLSGEQVRELQILLQRAGYAIGEIDGKLGAATRARVKAAQMKLGLPADSYPTAELIDRLRRTR